MIVFASLLVLCFVGVVIGMLIDMCSLFKEVYEDGSKKNKGLKGRRIFHLKTGGVSERKPCVDTGELRA